MRLPKKHQF